MLYGLHWYVCIFVYTSIDCWEFIKAIPLEIDSFDSFLWQKSDSYCSRQNQSLSDSHNCEELKAVFIVYNQCQTPSSNREEYEKESWNPIDPIVACCTKIVFSSIKHIFEDRFSWLWILTLKFPWNCWTCPHLVIYISLFVSKVMTNILMIEWKTHKLA